MTVQTPSRAQRRVAHLQLLHVLRGQLTRCQATVIRQQQLIAAMERDLSDAGITAHNSLATYRQGQGQDKTS